MITRKGFIASIGAALTGAASKAIKDKPSVGCSVNLYHLLATEAADLANPIWTPFDTLTSRTTAKLAARRRHRNSFYLWGPVVLCTPEDFEKRWAMLKGRKVHTRWSETAPRTGWWKYLGDNWRTTTPMNIQAYHAKKQDWLQTLKDLQEKVREIQSGDLQGGSE